MKIMMLSVTTTETVGAHFVGFFKEKRIGAEKNVLKEGLSHCLVHWLENWSDYNLGEYSEERCDALLDKLADNVIASISPNIEYDVSGFPINTRKSFGGVFHGEHTREDGQEESLTQELQEIAASL